MLTGESMCYAAMRTLHQHTHSNPIIEHVETNGMLKSKHGLGDYLRASCN